ncbi:MAG: chloride channel protein [Nitrospinota bacterium]
MIRRIRQSMSVLYSRFLSMDTALIVGLAVVVGVGAGMGAVVFRWLIQFFARVSFGGGKVPLGFLGQYYVILIPAIGGLFVGFLVYFFAREAKGHGVPEVMEAVALRQGRIRPIVALIKTLASSICIGSGGSAGREGPIVQIGSALGSTLGQKLRLSGERIRTLVACGAAGGIAATFNAPIAGAIFAMEVILAELSAGYFAAVIISSVTASAISRVFLGDLPAFRVQVYGLVSPWELLLYAGLGLLTACIAFAFVFLLYRTEDLFEGWRFPEYIKPAVGGLGIGLIGLYFPQVFGVGYETLEKILRNDITAVHLLLFLLAAKLVATSLTLGSGGSGGVFAPSLFMGAMLGGAFGLAVHTWFPTITAPPGAYALVGMAALFASAARAPMTSVLILFEMTRDYEIILPLGLAVAISTVIGRLLQTETIYTFKLKRRGIEISAFRDVNWMRTIKVEEAMTPKSELVTVSPEMSVRELIPLFQQTHSHGFGVVNGDGEFLGVVALSDVERAVKAGDLERKVGDICTTQVRCVFPDQTLEDAIAHFGAMDVGRIPVIYRGNHRRLVGMIRRPDIIRAYSQAFLSSQGKKHQNDADLD